ncbi:hypothetical protein SAMN05444283_12513 [Bacteroides stercoris]|nr:hypothetical protein SAMN05444283_12513 [Bacteroides stercoris]
MFTNISTTLIPFTGEINTHIKGKDYLCHY